MEIYMQFLLLLFIFEVYIRKMKMAIDFRKYLTNFKNLAHFFFVYKQKSSPKKINYWCYKHNRIFRDSRTPPCT